MPVPMRSASAYRPDPRDRNPRLAIQSPAVLQGTVSDPSGNPVAGAVVNAWVPLLDASGTPTGTGVQIATTSTGADGSYTLLLPPSP